MIKAITLDSGVRLVIDKIDTVQSAAVGVWVKNGAVDEPKKYAGISHFIEHMMFKGTSNRTAKQIAFDIDKIGGQINAFTGKEATCYYVKTTMGSIEKATDVIVDMLTNSLFEKAELDRERRVVCEEIKRSVDTPDDLAHEMIEDIVFKGRKIGNSILGTKTSLNRITSNVMRKYVAENYTTNNIVVSIAGNFDEDRMVEYFSDKFTTLMKSSSKSEFEAAGVEEETEREASSYSHVYKVGYKSVKKDIEQTHICLGTDGVSLLDEKYYPIAVLSNAMGGSMSSRLFQNIREQRGLAYSVYSMNQSFSNDGYYCIYAGVGQEYTEHAIEAIRGELLKLKDEGLTTGEIESSREQLRASYIFALESSAGRMFKNGKNLLLFDKIYEPEEVLDKIESVTSADIEKVTPSVCNFDDYSASVVSPNEIDARKMMKATS